MPVIERKKTESGRMNFRLPGEIKKRVESAALLSGLTVTDFAISALAYTAEEVLEKHNTRILSSRDRDIFLRMLDNPPAPNSALKQAVNEYRKRVKK